MKSNHYPPPPPPPDEPQDWKAGEPGYEGKVPAFGIGPVCDCADPTAGHEPTCAIVLARIKDQHPISVAKTEAKKEADNA